MCFLLPSNKRFQVTLVFSSLTLVSRPWLNVVTSMIAVMTPVGVRSTTATTSSRTVWRPSAGMCKGLWDCLRVSKVRDRTCRLYVGSFTVIHITCQLTYNQYTNRMESDIVTSVVISRYINNCVKVIIEGIDGWPVDNLHNWCHRNTKQKLGIE